MCRRDWVLLLYGFGGSNSGGQAWLQEPLPNEPSHPHRKLKLIVLVENGNSHGTASARAA